MTIALDIALLLPDAMASLAVGLNRQLDGGRPDGLTLDATHLPHLTLVQLFADDGRITQLTATVDRAAHAARALELRLTGLDDTTGTAMLVIRRSSELQDLHVTLMDVVREFEREGDAAAFYTVANGPARDRDVTWVSTYRSEHSDVNFLPHVTVGHGQGAGPAAPCVFRADRLAVCHLGRYCTCRRIIHERRLGPPAPASG